MTKRLMSMLAALLVLGLAAPVGVHAEPKAKQETSARPKKEPSAKQKAARNRMKECGREWQAMKKDGKAKATTWRKFSSDCLKRKKT